MRPILTWLTSTRLRKYKRRPFRRLSASCGGGGGGGGGGGTSNSISNTTTILIINNYSLVWGESAAIIKVVSGEIDQHLTSFAAHKLVPGLLFLLFGLLVLLAATDDYSREDGGD